MTIHLYLQEGISNEQNFTCIPHLRSKLGAFNFKHREISLGLVSISTVGLTTSRSSFNFSAFLLRNQISNDQSSINQWLCPQYFVYSMVLQTRKATKFLLVHIFIKCTFLLVFWKGRGKEDKWGGGSNVKLLVFISVSMISLHRYNVR